MNATRTLERHWRCATDAELARAWQAASEAMAAFAAVTAASGSLLQDWIAGREVVEYEHYPPDDVVDLRHGSQFYYHAHRHGGREHGHLHLFWHAAASGRRRHAGSASPRWSRTAPTHLLAISLDARGLPVGLFTVNRWVTDGHWFDAATTLSMLDRFRLDAAPGHALSCRWLVRFVEAYRPLVAALLEARDRRLARRADLSQALADRRLEVLSAVEIDWAADLDALEARARLRGCLTR